MRLATVCTAICVMRGAHYVSGRTLYIVGDALEERYAAATYRSGYKALSAGTCSSKSSVSDQIAAFSVDAATNIVPVTISSCGAYLRSDMIAGLDWLGATLNTDEANLISFGVEIDDTYSEGIIGDRIKRLVQDGAIVSVPSGLWPTAPRGVYAIELSPAQNRGAAAPARSSDSCTPYRIAVIAEAALLLSVLILAFAITVRWIACRRKKRLQIKENTYTGRHIAHTGPSEQWANPDHTETPVRSSLGASLSGNRANAANTSADSQHTLPHAAASSLTPRAASVYGTRNMRDGANGHYVQSPLRSFNTAPGAAPDAGQSMCSTPTLSGSRQSIYPTSQVNERRKAHSSPMNTLCAQDMRAHGFQNGFYSGFHSGFHNRLNSGGDHRSSSVLEADEHADVGANVYPSNTRTSASISLQQNNLPHSLESAFAPPGYASTPPDSPHHYQLSPCGLGPPCSSLRARSQTGRGMNLFPSDKSSPDL